MKLKGFNVPDRTPRRQQPFRTQHEQFTTASVIPPNWERSIHSYNGDPIARHNSLILTDTGCSLPKKQDPIFPVVNAEALDQKQEEVFQPPSKNEEPSFWQKGLITSCLTLSQMLAVVGPAVVVTNPQAVIAQEEKLPVPKEINIPKELDRIAREKIVIKFAEEAWAKIKLVLKDFEGGKNLNDILKENPCLGQLYCDLLVALHVADDTGVDIDQIRSELMEESAKKTIIPFELVHGVLHTNQVLVAELNKRIEKTSSDSEKIKLRERIKVLVKGSEEFLGKTIVDSKGKRYLLLPAEVKEIKDKDQEANVYTNETFPKLAAILIGTASIPEVIQSAVEGYRTFGNDKDNRDTLLEIFLAMKSGTVPAEALEISAQNIFGTASMAEHEKAVKEKAKTGKLPDLSTTIPPSSGKSSSTPTTGSLEELKNVQEKFPDQWILSPKLPNYQSLDSKDKLFLGKVVLLLANNKHEYTLPAAAQYFSIQHPSEGAKADFKASVTDFNVLEALAKYTHESKNTAALEIFKRTTASFPKLVLGDALLSGSVTTSYSQKRETGREVIKVCRTFPKEIQDLIRTLADQRAPLLHPGQPAQEEEQRTFNLVKDLDKQYALAVMAYLDTEKVFVTYLRERLESPLGITKEKERELVIVINGLVNAKDDQSIDRLLDLASKETKNTPFRVFLLEAVLQIDKKNFLPEEVYKITRESSAFATDHLQRLSYRDPETFEWTNLASNPQNLLNKGLVQKLVMARYDSWLASQTRANEEAVREGQEPISISDSTKIGKALEYINEEFESGGDRGILASRTKDPAFNKAKLLPMIKYLKSNSSERPIDIVLADRMMRILSKAQCEEATEVLIDMATNTVAPEEKQNEIYGVTINTSGIVALKASAIKFLGNAINLKDPNSKGAFVLHRMSYSASSRYRAAAQSGLEFLRRRYEAELSKPLPDEERKLLLDAQRAHGLKLFENLTRLQRGEEPSIPRPLNPSLEIEMARQADAFGATKEILLEVLKKERKNPRAGFVYNGLSALVGNNRKEEDIRKLGFSEDVTAKLIRLYNSVVDQEYFKGKNFPKLTEPLSIAIIDVGYIPQVNQIKNLKALEYPKDLISTSSDFTEPHPLAVLSGVGKLTGYENLSVLSLNVNGNIPKTESRTPEMGSALLQTYEHLTQELVRGRLFKYATNSYKLNRSPYSNEGLRTFQLSRAHFELQNRLGLTHLFAAGNERTEDSYGCFGSLSPLGYKIDRKRKIEPYPEWGLSIGAYDGFTNKIARFTSIGNELEPNSSPPSWFFPGVTEPGLYMRHGLLGDVTFWSGTSRAVPGALAILAICEEERANKGLPRFTNEQRRTALDNASVPLLGQAPNERGRVVPEKLLEQYLMPEPQIASREKK